MSFNKYGPSTNHYKMAAFAPAPFRVQFFSKVINWSYSCIICMTKSLNDLITDNVTYTHVFYAYRFQRGLQCECSET